MVERDRERERAREGEREGGRDGRGNDQPRTHSHLEKKDAEASAAVPSPEVVAIPQQLQHEGAAREGDAAADDHHLRAREARQEAHAGDGGGGDPEGGKAQAEDVALHGHEARHAELEPHLEEEEDDAHLSQHLVVVGGYVECRHVSFRFVLCVSVTVISLLFVEVVAGAVES